MAKKGGMAKLGVWAFIIGLILSIVIAIIAAASPPAWAIIVLAILGIIVGLLNVTDKEVSLFLVAGIGFILSFQALAGIAETVVLGWDAVGTFFSLLAIFIAPAVAIVAVKALFNVARD